MARGRQGGLRPLAMLAGTLLVGTLVGLPQAVGASSTGVPPSGTVPDDAVTVTVTGTAVGFLPRSIEVYSFDNTLISMCPATTTCSLVVPVGTHVVVRYEAPVPFTLDCPLGSNVDGPGLIDGLWYGWCGSHDITTIVASEDVTATATATGVVLPKAYIDTLPAWSTTTPIGFEWDGTDGNWPVTSFDVRYRRAAWNGGFGAYATWKAATTEEWGKFPASAGYTYCFSVRANASNGSHSPWTAESCTAVPLDDRSLTRSAHWTAGTGNAYFRSTSLRSTTSGATLTRTQVVAKRIALVATTCPTCGKVKVYWGSTLLKTISLVSATTVNKKVIAVATFSSARNGTVKIVQASGGKKVILDGLAIRRN